MTTAPNLQGCQDQMSKFGTEYQVHAAACELSTLNKYLLHCYIIFRQAILYNIQTSYIRSSHKKSIIKTSFACPLESTCEQASTDSISSQILLTFMLRTEFKCHIELVIFNINATLQRITVGIYFLSGHKLPLFL